MEFHKVTVFILSGVAYEILKLFNDKEAYIASW